MYAVSDLVLQLRLSRDRTVLHRQLERIQLALFWHQRAVTEGAVPFLLSRALSCVLATSYARTNDSLKCLKISRGIVQRALLDAIKEKSVLFYSGSSLAEHDVYMSSLRSLSNVLDRHIQAMGASARKLEPNSALFMTDVHQAIEEADALPQQPVLAPDALQGQEPVSPRAKLDRAQLALSTKFMPYAILSDWSNTCTEVGRILTKRGDSNGAVLTQYAEEVKNVVRLRSAEQARKR